jgi:hypothetical protein
VGRKPHATDRPSELHLVLRWLRHRLRLTQGEVAQTVRDQGGALSLRHYQDVESGQKHPSPELRTQILRALGSDEGELSGLLTSQPWAASSTGRYHASRVLPRPDAYVAAGRRALEALPTGATWSSPIAAEPLLVEAGPSDDPGRLDLHTVATMNELGRLLPRLSDDGRRRVLDLARRLADEGANPGAP